MAGHSLRRGRARVAQGEAHEDFLSYKRWFPITEDGGKLSSDDDLPIVWPPERRSGPAKKVNGVVDDNANEL